MTNTDKNFVAIISVTKNCPLRCEYCYVHKKDSSKMSINTVKRIIDELFQINKLPTTEIIWHGGEPLLMGLSFYKTVCEYISKNYPNKKVVHKLQTSGYLINEEWIDFFKEFKFDVGISLDGPEFIHDKQRKDKSGKPTFAKIFSSAKLMEQHGLRPGFIAVITKNSLDFYKEIFNFFYENKWQFSFAKVSITNDDNTDLGISVDEYLTFYERILDLFISQQEFRLKIVPIYHHILSYMKGTSVGLCVNEHSCAENYLSFSPDGNVFNCNRFIDYPTESFGNILKQPLLEILKSEKRLEFLNRPNAITESCSNCSIKKVCNGGCPYEDFVKSNSIYNKEYECITHKGIYSLIDKKLRSELRINSNV